MFTSRTMVLGLCAALLSGVLARQACAQGREAPPELEKYAGKGRTAEFIRDAGIWVERHPEDPASPRLMYELLLMGKLGSSRGLEDAALTKLALDYPESASARFAILHVKDDAFFREFLNRLVRERLDGDISRFAEQFCGAVELGLKAFDSRFYPGDDFLLNVAMLAAEADRGMLRRSALKGLEQARPEVKQIVGISFDDKTTTADKFVKLGEIRDSQPARQCQKILYSRMTGAEMAERRVVRTLAENLLVEGKHAEANSLLGELDDGRDPQLIYWQGLCHLAQADGRAAQAAFDRLVKQHPKSPWAVAALELAPRIAGRDKLVDEYAEALVAVGKKLRTGVGAVEAQFVWRDSAGKPARIYFGMVPSEQRLEVMIRRGERPVLGYLSARDQCQFYFDGDEAIFRFGERGVFPVPKAALEEDSEGELRINTSLDFSNRFDAAWEANQAMLESPLLSTRQGLAKVLRTTIGQSGLPCPVDTRDGMRTFVWLVPNVDRPEVTRVTYVLSREETLISFSGGRLACERLRYGPRDQVVLTGTSWPRLPVALRERFEPVVIMKLLSAAVQVLESEQPLAPAHNASRPGDPLRR